MNIQLVPFGHQSSYFYNALNVYCQVWGRDYNDSLMFFKGYRRFPNFEGCVAIVNDYVVGFAFGTRSEYGQWWHEKVAKNVEFRHPALRNAWVLTEIGVLAEYRDLQIGGMLHDTVIESQPLPNVLLSTQASNTGARRFYERRGWTYLHNGFAFNRGSQPYVVMHRHKEHVIKN